MHQDIPAAPRAPTPPQSPADLGDIIKGAVNNTLQSVAAELDRELARTVAKRANLQAQLDVATSSSQRGKLREQIAQTDREIDKLEQGIAKLSSKTSTGQGTPYIPPNFRNARDVVPE